MPDDDDLPDYDYASIYGADALATRRRAQYVADMARLEAILAEHPALMARLESLTQANKDLLERLGGR